MATEYCFELNQGVELRQSGERGIVIGRAEYLSDEPRYLVSYRAGDGRQVEDWWRESSLHA